MRTDVPEPDMPLLPIADAPATGTHVFVVGVSHYPYLSGDEATAFGETFGMSDLSSAARSASDFAAWVLVNYRNDDAPLASLNVLLSPSDDEETNSSISDRLPDECAATRGAVERELGQFRERCAGPGNVAIVYVAGHGVQLSKHGAILLLEDFAREDPDHPQELYGALDIAQCHAAFNYAEGAPNQLWFSDTCRQAPRVAQEFERFVGAFALSERWGNVDSSPLFLAASSREAAWSETGGQTLFVQALLWALRGNAADGPDDLCPNWYVGVSQLVRHLSTKVAELAAPYGVSQNVDVTGRVNHTVAQMFEKPPEVPIEVALVEAPPGTRATGSLHPDQGDPVSWDSWPLRRSLGAGLYLLDVNSIPPATRPRIPVRLWPPGSTVTVEIEP